MKQETLDSAQLLAEQKMAKLGIEIATLERGDPLDEKLLISLHGQLARRTRQWNVIASRIWLMAIGSQS